MHHLIIRFHLEMTDLCLCYKSCFDVVNEMIQQNIGLHVHGNAICILMLLKAII